MVAIDFSLQLRFWWSQKVTKCFNGHLQKLKLQMQKDSTKEFKSPKFEDPFVTLKLII